MTARTLIELSIGIVLLTLCACLVAVAWAVGG
jgi:hypothetical protein